jgi:sulfatase maturation enzyme AslB (radical SAM superfamily)
MSEYCIGSKILAHLDKVDKAIAGEIKGVITCEINSSNYCQNNCEWCIYKDYIRSNRCHLDLPVFVKAISELKLLGCRSITFTGGGEPLMNPHIDFMISHAKEMGFELGLITNGINLNIISDQIEDFKFIRVSLDATSREEYIKYKRADYFDRVCKNIKSITSKSNIDFGISMLYIPGNEESANNFSELGNKLGCTYSQIKPLVDDDVEQNNKVVRNIKGSFPTERYVSSGMIPCLIAGLIGQVSADGCCYYCCIHAGKPQYKIGDLSVDSLRNILERRQGFVPDFDDCSVCRYMNYAIEYLKVKDNKYRLLRHISFL